MLRHNFGSCVAILNFIYLNSNAIKFDLLRCHRRNIKIKSAAILFNITLKFQKSVTMFPLYFALAHIWRTSVKGTVRLSSTNFHG
jgi:hypothetical protein